MYACHEFESHQSSAWLSEKQPLCHVRYVFLCGIARIIIVKINFTVVQGMEVECVAMATQLQELNLAHDLWNEARQNGGEGGGEEEEEEEVEEEEER